MHYKLSTGQNIEVKFNHIYKTDKKTKQTKPYGTECHILIDENEHSNKNSKEQVTLHYKDVFSKKKGRLKSFNKALSLYRRDGFVFLSKIERRELFNLVFPQLKNNGPNSKKAKRLLKVKDFLVKTMQETKTPIDKITQKVVENKKVPSFIKEIVTWYLNKVN